MAAGVIAARLVGAEAANSGKSPDKILSELTEIDAYAEMMLLHRGLHSVFKGQLHVMTSGYTCVCVAGGRHLSMHVFLLTCVRVCLHTGM